MSNGYKEEGNRKILQRSVRLCQSIEPYIDVLGLDWNDVRNFKDEIQAMLYITENYKSFANSFLLHNVGAIRLSMELLMRQCTGSAAYNEKIGKALGIEEDSKFNTNIFPDLTFYLSHLN